MFRMIAAGTCALVLLASCSMRAGTPTSKAGVGASPSVGNFSALLSSANDGDAYVFSSVEEIVKASDVVVTGRISGIDRGRSFLGDDDRIVFRTAVISLDGPTALAGDPSKLEGDVVVEVIVEDSSFDDLKSSVPLGQPVVLFLSDYTQNRNRMIGEQPFRMYLFPFQQGFLMEDGGEIVSVLGGLVAPASLKDLATVIDAIRSTQMVGSR